MSLNKEISITGNVGKDKESQYTDTGKLVTKFSLAVTTGYGDKQTTEWYQCVAWERTAEILAQNIDKGSKLQVRGDFKLEAWTDKNSGEARAKLVITVKEFQFLSPKKKEESHSDDEPEFMKD